MNNSPLIKCIFFFSFEQLILLINPINSRGADGTREKTIMLVVQNARSHQISKNKLTKAYGSSKQTVLPIAQSTQTKTKQHQAKYQRPT
jgi:hypothetical protein